MAWDNPPSEVDVQMEVTSVTSQVVGTDLVGEMVISYTMSLIGFQEADRNLEATGGTVEVPSPTQVEYPSTATATVKAPAKGTLNVRKVGGQ